MFNSLADRSIGPTGASASAPNLTSYSSLSSSASLNPHHLVRAFFNYDPSKDTSLPGKGLKFNQGDILYVTNAFDDEWWKASRVNLLDGSEESLLGIVPSKKRVDRKLKAQQRKVNFEKFEDELAARDDGRNTLKKKEGNGLKRFLINISINKKGVQIRHQQKSDDVAILSYVLVNQEELNYLMKLNNI